MPHRTRRHRSYHQLLPALIVLAGCGLSGASPSPSLAVSGTGSGDASGTWTSHFTVDRGTWRFAFHLDCSRAHTWSFDVTLEKMHSDNYFDAVPLDLGWSAAPGKPGTIALTRSVRGSGEFWYIVRASRGCEWRLAAPTG
jgi:hypothetical protein